MAGDLNVTERAVLQDPELLGAVGEPAPASGGSDAARVIHRYGRLAIEAGGALPTADAGVAPPMEGLGELEKLGLAALMLRESPEYREMKANRPRAGEEWDMPDCTTVVPTPDLTGAVLPPVHRRPRRPARISRGPSPSGSSSCRVRRRI